MCKSIETHGVEILQRLYDSEINVEITWMWDGGVEVSLFNRYTAANETPNNTYTADNVAQGIHWLAKRAFQVYPNSAFSRWWCAANYVPFEEKTQHES